jgi:putative ABC transport system permease protein
MQTLWQDIRFGLRMLIKTPGFTLIAIFTLALGIGASSAMFSFFDAVLFKPLAYQAPEQLVLVWERSSGRDMYFPLIPTFQEWREQNQVFSHMSAVHLGVAELNLTGRGVAEHVRGLFVSANYFELLGARPALGRFFNPDEDQAGKGQAAVLTNRYWKQRFAGDPKVLGSDITLNNQKYTVIGVAAPHSAFDRGSTDVWLPMVFTPEQIRSKSRFFMVEARLKPGVTIEKAGADMKRITEGLAQQGLIADKNVSPLVQPLRDWIVGSSRQMMSLLMGAVIFILLIACANVANLLLARSATRSREIAIRAALGAGRLRIFRQLLVESLLLAVAGGGLGVVLAFWLIKGFTVLMPPSMIPAEIEATIDWRVLLFTLGTSLLTAIIFGLAPAWRASRTDLTRSLQERGDGASAHLGRNKLRSLLLVSEIALTFTLVIGAALLIRSFARLLQTDPGFQTERILTFQTNLDKTRYPQAHQVIGYQTEMLNGLRVLPGAQSAATANAVPLRGGPFRIISIIGGLPGEKPAREIAAISVVSPEYFETFGIRLLRGRYLSDHDTAQTSPVVVINESLAKQHWFGADPVGRQIQFPGVDFASLSFTIVGVIADHKQTRLQNESRPEVYILFSQTPEKAFPAYGRKLYFAVRTTNEPSALTSAIRGIAAGVDRDQPLYDIITMEEIYSESVATPRFQTAVFSAFGTLALIFAAVGVYGVMAYSVNQRTREIGIRMALGAQSGDMMRLVMWQGLALASAGIGVGLGAAFTLTRFLTAYLYEIKATDASTSIVVALILLSVAMLGSYLPAWRAMKVDPMVVLRHD